MELTFRKFPANDASPPAPGEIQVRACRPEHQSRLDLAALVLEHGLDVLRQGSGTIERLVVRADPSLDDLLAAAFAARLLEGQSLPEGAKAFARYAALVREGLRPSEIPLERSLEGFFLAIRNGADPDLSVPENGARFAADWSRMAARLWQAAEAAEDPFTTPLFGSDFARERAFLTRDHEVYCQDVLSGSRWSVQLPDGPPEATALYLTHPKSLLFKYWSRQPQQNPPGPAYLFLAVDWGEGQWVFSTDPVQRLSLKLLADALQTAESIAEPARAASDPWFDGKPFGHTLVAAPRAGTLLPPGKVIQVVQKWTRARPLRPRSFGWLKGGTVAAAVLLLAVAVGWFTHTLRLNPPTLSKSEDIVRGLIPDNNGPDRFGSTSRGLYVLAIGVSDYEDPKITNLTYADKDAEAVAEAFQKLPDGGQFTTLKCYKPLVNDKATRTGILAALEQLRKDVHPGDLAVITLSGHGAKYNNYFYFLPHDYSSNNTNSSGVSWDDFKHELAVMPCSVWIVLDTCHSGAVTVETISLRGSDLTNSGQGMVVTAACMSNESERENPQWKHGALTLALLEGLAGRQFITGPTTATLPIRDVTLEDLNHYLIVRVNELGHGKQAVVTNQTGDVSLARLCVFERGK